MKKKAIFSQVTAVLELDFYQQLELLTDINDVQQKLLREVSQTCVLHTSSSDTWLIQGCLDDIVKAHQLLKAISNCICPVKGEKNKDSVHDNEGALKRKNKKELKPPLVCKGSNDTNNGSQTENSLSSKVPPYPEILPQKIEPLCIRLNSTQRKQKKESSRKRHKHMPTFGKQLEKNMCAVAQINETDQQCSKACPSIPALLNRQLSESSSDVSTKNDLHIEIDNGKTGEIQPIESLHITSDQCQHTGNHGFMTHQGEDDKISMCTEIENHSLDIVSDLEDVVGEGLHGNDSDDEVERTKTEGRSKKSRIKQCHLCGKDFTSSSNLSKHLKSAHLGIRFWCGIGECKKCFSDKPALLRHCKRVHEKLQCDKCRILCHSEEQLYKHTAICNAGPFQAVCVFCGKVYTSVSNLNKHIKSSHTGQKISCDLCGKSYKTTSNLRDHRENQHDLFDCTRCNKKNLSEVQFEVHMKETHGTPFNVVNLSVEQSTKSQTSTSVYIRQKRTRHPTNCPRCNKTFSSVSNMNHHMRRVHLKHREICPQCGQSFSALHHLNRHLSMVHETSNYPCNLCDKYFTTRVSLCQHQSTEHGQIALSDLTCQCEICGRTFLYKSNLDRHIRTDHQKLRFTCDQCQSEFSTKYARNEHIKSEHQGQRLLCHYCPRMFKLKHKLCEHVNLKHSDQKTKTINVTDEGLIDRNTIHTWVLTDELAHHVTRSKDQSVSQSEVCLASREKDCIVNTERKLPRLDTLKHSKTEALTGLYTKTIKIDEVMCCENEDKLPQSVTLKDGENQAKTRLSMEDNVINTDKTLAVDIAVKDGKSKTRTNICSSDTMTDRGYNSTNTISNDKLLKDELTQHMILKPGKTTPETGLDLAVCEEDSIICKEKFNEYNARFKNNMLRMTGLDMAVSATDRKRRKKQKATLTDPGLCSLSPVVDKILHNKTINAHMSAFKHSKSLPETKLESATPEENGRINTKNTQDVVAILKYNENVSEPELYPTCHAQDMLNNTDIPKRDYSSTLKKSTVMSSLQEVGRDIGQVQMSEKTPVNKCQAVEMSRDFETIDKTQLEMSGLSSSNPSDSAPSDNNVTGNNAGVHLLNAAALSEHYVSSEVGFHTQPLPLLNVSRTDPEDILQSALETHGIVPDNTVNATHPVSVVEEHYMPLDFHSALNMAVFKTHPDIQPSSIPDQMDSSLYAMVSPEPASNSCDLPYGPFTGSDLFSREFL